jgi:hypothetical protein
VPVAYAGVPLPRRRALETAASGGTAPGAIDCFETLDTEALREELDLAGSFSPFIRVSAEQFSLHAPVVAAKMRLLPVPPFAGAIDPRGG